MESILFYDANIKELAEKLSLGPQAEVLELLEIFNNKYISNSNDIYSLRRQARMETKPLSITKKFTWKPGAYDTIKAIINGSLCFNMRAQSLGKIIDRVRSEGNWRMRNLDTDVSEIENILFRLRSEGIIMQDNADDAILAYEILKNHFIEQYQNSNGSFDIRIEEVKDHNDELIDYNVWVNYSYYEPAISYKHAGGPEIAKVIFRGDVFIRIKYSLTRLINVLINQKMDIKKLTMYNVKNQADFSRGIYSTGGYVTNDHALLHPFISSSEGWQNRNRRSETFKYVCFGNLYNEISACLGSLDFISGKIFMDRLVTHYDTQTGPLNQISKSYCGVPHELEYNTEFRDIVPSYISSNCNYYHILESMPQDIIKTDSYCANYCSYAKNCNAYAEFTKEISVEEKERIALETATINAATRRI